MTPATAGKVPVLLTVLVETGQFRWYVAGVGLDGISIPLLCSETGNLLPCLGVSLDEQITFLRHRFSGVLQRGCDRLWGRQMKPCQIVFISDGPIAQAEPDLLRNVGEHFATWMTKPPVVTFMSPGCFRSPERVTLDLVAGAIDPEFRQGLEAGLPGLFAAIKQSEAWELVVSKPDQSHSAGTILKE
jgi:hypothetical protein